MITFFIAVSQSFIDSGFSQALIRKQDCSDTDLSTVFIFNFIVGCLFFAILFLSAPAISNFYNEPQLTMLVRVLSVVLVIDALSMVQRTILTRRIDFKLQTKISVIATVSSGVIGITMAFKGFGVWSLVAKTISQRVINSFLLWIWNKWIPKLIFSIDSFKNLFSFGSRLLVSGLMETAYQNVYYLIIGKIFSAKELGYYTRADQFQKLPSSNINGIITRVSYPVLSKLQDDDAQLKAAFRKLIKSSMLISFVLMFGLAAVAKPLVLTLIGEKWRNSIIYLQLLCFVGVQYPIHALNLNLLQIKGRSDLFLRLEIIKKVLVIPVILFGIFYGINAMIVGMAIFSAFAIFLNGYWTKRFINYSVITQIKDIFPSFLIALISALIVSFAGYFLPLKSMYILIIQLILGASIVIALCELLNINEYREIKVIAKSYLLANNV